MPPAVLIGGSLVILAGSVAALWVLAPLLRVGAAVAARSLARWAAWRPLLRAAADEVASARAGADSRAQRSGCPSFSGSRSTARTTVSCRRSWSRRAPRGELGFLRVFLSVAGAEMAASLPLPTVMSLGPYEAAGAAGFAYWLGLPRELATLAVTAFHGLSQVHDYALGLLAWSGSWWRAAPARRSRARDRATGE